MAGYESTYSTKRRAIFRWQSIGREKNDPPPLSRPTEMLAWWERCMKHRAPEKIRQLAEAGPASAPVQVAAPAAEPAEPPPAKAVPAPVPVDFSRYADVGLEAHVRQLGRDLNGLQDQLNTARREGAARSVIKALQDDVNDTLDLYSRCTAKLDEQRKRRGDLIDIADVQEDWGMLLASLASMRERMVADVDQALATALAGFREGEGQPLPLSAAQAAAVRAAVKAAVREARDREDRHLRSAKHWHDSDAADRTAA